MDKSNNAFDNESNTIYGIDTYTPPKLPIVPDIIHDLQVLYALESNPFRTDLNEWYVTGMLYKESMSEEWLRYYNIQQNIKRKHSDYLNKHLLEYKIKWEKENDIPFYPPMIMPLEYDNDEYN